MYEVGYRVERHSIQHLTGGQNRLSDFAAPGAAKPEFYRHCQPIGCLSCPCPAAVHQNEGATGALVPSPHCHCPGPREHRTGAERIFHRHGMLSKLSLCLWVSGQDLWGDFGGVSGGGAGDASGDVRETATLSGEAGRRGDFPHGHHAGGGERQLSGHRQGVPHHTGKGPAYL